MSGVVLLLAVYCAGAQTLARPGWAGSGIASEAWWRNAVFYRIDIQHFQDSDGDGVGDLGGIARRLDYLQSLGVDAIVIAPSPDESGFDELLREAADRRIRIVIGLDGPATSAEALGRARLWLTRGAAGISVEASLLQADPKTHAGPVSMHDLRALTDSFPGERVLLADGGQGSAGSQAKLTGFQIDSPMAAVGTDSAGTLRQALSELQTPPVAGTPLLESDSAGRSAGSFGGDPVRSAGFEKIVAAELLTSRGAVSLLYGQELGIVGAAEPVTMQWTPSNVTPPKVEAEPEVVETKPAAAGDPNVYGGFKPYVPPKPKAKPLPAGVVPAVDANSLPGFTTRGTASGKSLTTVNAAVEDADPNSLLNYYRRLIQLHHDSASLRSGTAIVLDHDADNALVWIRRAPAEARTAGTVVVVCNLSGKALTLSLDGDFARLHLRSGTLRPLLGSWTAMPLSQYSSHIVVPPYGTYMAEVRP